MKTDHGTVDVHAHRTVRGGVSGGRVDASQQVGPGGCEVEHNVLVDLALVQPVLHRLVGPQTELRIQSGLYAWACRGSLKVGKSPNTLSRSSSERDPSPCES